MSSNCGERRERALVVPSFTFHSLNITQGVKPILRCTTINVLNLSHNNLTSFPEAEALLIGEKGTLKALILNHNNIDSCHQLRHIKVQGDAYTYSLIILTLCDLLIIAVSEYPCTIK
jgi:hypothetical protein